MCSERHSTFITFVGFHTVVDPHMNFEITTLSELPLTDRALERFQTFVGPFVDLKTARSRVCFVALTALIRQFSSVDQFMSLEVSACNKQFSTGWIRTLKRSLPSLSDL
jgi:hypothetical protein